MKQQLSPVVVAVIVIVVLVVVGLVGWKVAFAPKGINAPPPPNATNPNAYTPQPAGAVTTGPTPTIGGGR